MMKENSPICARPMPTRREVRRVVAGEKRADASSRRPCPRRRPAVMTRIGTGIVDQQLRIDQQADGHEEDGAEHVAHRFEERLDAVNFPRLGDDRRR